MSTARAGARLDRGLLGIYLNDHLTGAVGGVALARRAAGSHRGTPAGDELARLAHEIEEDQDALLEIMRALGIRRTRYKEPFALVAERLGRLKLNGSLLQRSPLSSVVELEGMKLGVAGKLSGWLMLRRLAGLDAALDAAKLDELITRAERQHDALEQLRSSIGVAALTTP